MKNINLLSALVLGAALVLNGTGCKHNSKSPVLITGHNAIPSNQDPNLGGTTGQIPNEKPAPFDPTKVDSTNGFPIDPGSKYAEKLAHGEPDRGHFASDTVFFDTDSSTIKKSEESKIQHVADYFKGNDKEALHIEGYCDERGTEQYNVALGDRRAQAVRDYLANLGVDPQRIASVSMGEANPEDSGHGEEHWKKNRRGVFVLMK